MPTPARPMTTTTPRPAERMCALSAYRPTRPRQPIDLWLDANEGARDDGAGEALLRAITPEDVRRYPDPSALERRIAEARSVDPDRVLVTAGGDDAINRLCLATLEPGRSLLQHTPTFTMIEHSARLAGAEARSVPWMRGPFPLDAFLAEIREGVGLVALVSPNNPTGASIGLSDIRAVASRAASVGAMVLVDLAYAEFAGEDPTDDVLTLGNTVVVRTLSKAWAMAGLRVGYAMGPADVLEWCRATGGPFAVSGVSLAAAGAILAAGARPDVAMVRRIADERARLGEILSDLGARPIESRANFVLGEWPDRGRALWVRDALAGLGIWVRCFSDGALGHTTRITCPGDDAAFERLERALRVARAPEAILFDLDGVIADVSRSYRAAIGRTIESFGGSVTPAEVAAAKRVGDANNDWVLSRRLLERQGIGVALEEVTARFEAFYQGDDSGDPKSGLWRTESLLLERASLERFRAAGAGRIGIVTGRPRRDARRFLETNGIADLVDTLVCMEDGPPKPAPGVVRLALDRLGVSRAWMIGDTVDDVRAARAAGVVPIGVIAPGDDPLTTTDALLDAGGARVLARVEDTLELLP